MSSIATTNNNYTKSNFLQLLNNNESISYHYINMFLIECYSSNDIESVQKLVESPQMFTMFLDEHIYYSYTHEIHSIMMLIAKFNNIDIINTIMHHANEYVDNDKQQDAGCYIAAILYKYNFDITAEELVNKYYLNKGNIIINMYINGCDFKKMKYIISKYPESIQVPNIREWLLVYSARYDNIEMIKFLKQYYEYTSEDIFNILFNFSKSTAGSKELYIFIFNNYIDIIKNESSIMIKLIKYIFQEEHYELIYFILSKIQFSETDLVNILTCVFDYPYFFDEIIENITNVMINLCEMKPVELRNIYNKINNESVQNYIQQYL